MGFIFRMPQN